MALAAEGEGEERVALVEETVTIGRREVQTDRVRVRTVVEAEDVVVEDRVRVGGLDVERVAVERQVAEAPAPYREGGTLVIPVVEERLVVEKRLFVVEEVRVVDTSRERTVQVPVSLRRTRAIVERDGQQSDEEGRN